MTLSSSQMPGAENIWNISKLQELGKCKAPRWVRHKAKYRDMCKHFKSEMRKAKVDPDAFDFDHDIYDDEADKAWIQATIHNKVWGAAQGPEVDERLAAKNEERMEIPRKEHDRLMRIEEERDALQAVEGKWKECAQKGLDLCRKIGRVNYGKLQLQLKNLKKECPGNYRDILRRKRR